MGCFGRAGHRSGLLLAVVEIDGRVDRETCDHWLFRNAVERDPNRHSLSNLDPIAIRILRRKQ